MEAHPAVMGCTFILLLAILPVVMPALISEVSSAFDTYYGPSEYERYTAIRDANNCTKANDSECVKASICIHAYEHCQRMQCPGAFP